MEPQQKQMEPFLEVDPSGRYGRYSTKAPGYSEVVPVYKAFDQEKGVIVSWHRIHLKSSTTDLNSLYSKLSLLKSVQSKNVITTYKVWRDKSQDSLNFITEFCSSENLSELRNEHSQISIRTIKKWSKQILKGLRDLHKHDPCIVHGALNCSNVFVNGTTGQAKVGGLGNPIIEIPNLEGCAADIYHYGALVSELVAPFDDDDGCAAAAFIRKCTRGKTEAADLLQDPFFNGISCDCKEEEEKKAIPKTGRSSYSWRMKMPYILQVPFYQYDNICWAVALARALSALRKLHGYPEGPGARSLTYKDLINSVHPRCFQSERGAIRKLEHAADFLVGEGIVSDMIVHHMPMDKDKDKHEEFEMFIESLLNKSPVAVSVTSFSSYSDIKGKGVYKPTDEEVGRYDHEVRNYHSVLLTGYGIDEDTGMPYWELQDSYGAKWGDNGFIRIARHHRLIEEMVEIKL